MGRVPAGTGPLFVVGDTMGQRAPGSLMFSFFIGEYENALGGDGVWVMNAKQSELKCQRFGKVLAGRPWRLVPHLTLIPWEVGFRHSPFLRDREPSVGLLVAKATQDKPSRSFLRQF